MSNTLKVLLIAAVLIAIAAFGYWYATSTPTTTGGSALQSSGSQLAGGSSPLSQADTAISDKFLSLLLNMRTIKLDQSLFTDPAFSSLRDFSTTINPESNPGRENPFAPIGIDAIGTQSVVVTTTQPTSVTKNTAVLTGSIPVGSVVAKRYFEYGTTGATPLPNTTAGVPNDVATGGFTFTLNGLVPNTTYYYRAVVVSGGSPVYGSIVSFKTLAQ